jgi:hypothetical protein
MEMMERGQGDMGKRRRQNGREYSAERRNIMERGVITGWSLRKKRKSD